MFCPKCGNSLPDNAKFCVKCGAALQERVEQTAQPVAQSPVQPAVGQANVRSSVSPSYTGSAGVSSVPSVGASLSAFSPVSLVARAAAVIAAICMFLPWAGVPLLGQVRDYASMLGFNSVPSGDLSVLGLGDAINTISSYVGSNSLQGLYTFFMFLWAAGLILLIAGIVKSLIGNRGMGLMAMGCFVAVVIAIIWMLVVVYVNSANRYEILSIAGGCFGTCIFASVGFVLSLASRTKA